MDLTQLRRAPDARNYQHFWQKFDSHHFSATTTAIYFKLMRYAAEYEESSTDIPIVAAQLILQLKISRPIFMKGVDELRKAGLIEYRSGIGRGKKSIFSPIGAGMSDRKE